MRKILKLRHHKHTGKVLRHHHTSYRALFLLLMILGTTLVSTAQTVYADDMVVTAKVQADPPTTPAEITQPPDGTVVFQPNITISGTCEDVDPVTIIEIYSGPYFLGSTTCSGSGDFTIIVTLRPGLNPLKARSVSITEDYGPDSSIVNVTYQPLDEEGDPIPIPQPARPGAPAPPLPPGVLEPLEIRSKPTFIQFSQNKDAVWSGLVAGGKSPYNLGIDWGDGIEKRRQGIVSEEITFSHRYDHMQTYVVKVSASDSAGQTVEHTLAAVTLHQKNPNVFSFINRINFPGALAQIYIAFVLLLVFLFLVWFDARVLKWRFVPVGVASGRRGR